MEKREDRRDRTIRYGERARRVRERVLCPLPWAPCAPILMRVRPERTAWFFAKGKSVGCRCRRVQRSLSPKIPGSLCHDGIRGYHPCVSQRIQGKRLVKAWLSELRGAEADDVEL
jgi:hypothetical protein